MGTSLEYPGRQKRRTSRFSLPGRQQRADRNGERAGLVCPDDISGQTGKKKEQVSSAREAAAGGQKWRKSEFSLPRWQQRADRNEERAGLVCPDDITGQTET